MVRLNKAHSTHISSKVENPLTPSTSPETVVEISQVYLHKLVAKVFLFKKLIAVPISNPDPVPLFLESLGCV